MNRSHFVVLVMLIVLASSTYALVNETISYDNTEILENQLSWLNITFDSPNVYDKLLYNNTILSTTRTTNATHTKFTKQLTTPKLTKDTNISFLWEYNSIFDDNFYLNINNLISYWPMNFNTVEINVTKVLDINSSNDGLLSGYILNNGTLNESATINFSNGKYGKGLGIDGIRGEVQILDNDILDVGGIGITVCLWFNMSRNQETFNSLVQKGNSMSATDGYYFNIDSSNPGFLQASLGDGSTQAIAFKQYSTDIAGTSQHACFTYDRVTGNLSLWTNGVIFESITQVLVLDMNTAARLFIGSRNDQQFLNGSIDSVRIWDRPLQDSEILADFNNQTMYPNCDGVRGLVLNMNFENSNASETWDENNICHNGFRSDLQQANYFDGTDDRIISESNLTINDSQDRTLSLWFRSLGSSDQQRIAGWGITGTKASFFFRIDTSDNIFFSSSGPGGDFDIGENSDGEWHHLAATYDGTTVRTYFDGVPSSTPSSAIALVTGTSPLYIGVIIDGVSQFFNGSIDDVIIFNRSLSSTEIGYLYNHTYHTNSTQNEQQIFFWDLDNCSNYTTSAFNFEIRDENTNNLIFANVSYVYNFFNDLDGTFNKQYSKTMLNQNNYSFCKTPSFVNLTGDMSHTVTSSTHETRSFLRSNVEYTGTFISYLVQISATVQTVLFKIVDTTLASIEGATMQFTKVINSIPTIVAKQISDFAGQVSLPLDSTTTYQIQINASGFPLKTFNLKPALSSYTIKLNTSGSELFSNNYEGIRYKITPSGRTFNASNEFINFTFELDGSNLEYFGLNFSRHNFECIPANCQNISTSSNGGIVTVKIKVNATSRFYTNLFFKVEGKDQVNINSWPNDGVIFYKAAKSAINLLDNIKEDVGPMTLAILAAFIQVVIIGIAVQVGVAGIPLIMIGAASVMILSIPQIGLINPLFGVFLAIVGFIMYGLLAMVSNQ